MRSLISARWFLRRAARLLLGWWLARLVGPRAALALVGVAAFVGLTWVRAESLAAMLPAALNLSLGVVTGLLGSSLSGWIGALGAAPDRACLVAKSLKVSQILGVPAGYLLLGGHMLALPLVGAALALAGVLWAHRGHRSCARRFAASGVSE